MGPCAKKNKQNTKTAKTTKNKFFFKKLQKFRCGCTMNAIP